jgi:putative copper export protein
LLAAFSPTALLCGALVALTGLLAASVRLGRVPALWRSGYGLRLVLKLGVLVIVGGLGAVNWLVFRPRVGTDGA